MDNNPKCLVMPLEEGRQVCFLLKGYWADAKALVSRTVFSIEDTKHLSSFVDTRSLGSITGSLVVYG